MMIFPGDIVYRHGCEVQLESVIVEDKQVTYCYRHTKDDFIAGYNAVKIERTAMGYHARMMIFCPVEGPIISGYFKTIKEIQYTMADLIPFPSYWDNSCSAK